MGHVRDLPERALGVDVEHDFAPQYVPIKGRAKVLAELQAAAAKIGPVKSTMPRIELLNPSRLPPGDSRFGPHVTTGLMLHEISASPPVS